MTLRSSNVHILFLLPIVVVLTIVDHGLLFASAFLVPRDTDNFVRSNQYHDRYLSPTSTISPQYRWWTSSKQISSSSSLKALVSSSSWWSVTNCLGREDALALLESEDFLPSQTYGDRKTFGLVAAERECGATGGSSGEDNVGVIMADDPRLARTYAEFPLASLDILLDAAVDQLSSSTTAGADIIQMVDVGSGLGNIVLYSALTRRGGGSENGNESTDKNWKVCGIEISSMLHSRALELVQTGIEKEIFKNSTLVSDRENSPLCYNSLSFHLGSATENEGSAFLGNADIIFAYSTVFKAKYFDPDVGALLLDAEEWSKPLSEACKTGCVAVTTDRALDPRFGWKVVERIDVPNPDVLGTTGFVHVLEKEKTNEAGEERGG